MKNIGLVSYDKLQERLISTGKFYASEAFMMIEHMEKCGKIEQTGSSHVYRMAPPKIRTLVGKSRLR
jgi:hypothetical protein